MLFYLLISTYTPSVFPLFLLLLRSFCTVQTRIGKVAMRMRGTSLAQAAPEPDLAVADVAEVVAGDAGSPVEAGAFLARHLTCSARQKTTKMVTHSACEGGGAHEARTVDTDQGKLIVFEDVGCNTRGAFQPQLSCERCQLGKVGEVSL